MGWLINWISSWFDNDPVPDPEPVPIPPIDIEADSKVKELYEVLNRERVSRNLAPLTPHPKVQAAAQGHAEWMASWRLMVHGNPGGRLTKAGVNWTSYAENIAAGYQTAEAVHRGWMNSWGHRANNLSNHKYVGAGLKNGYWCLNFANIKGE